VNTRSQKNPRTSSRWRNAQISSTRPGGQLTPGSLTVRSSPGSRRLLIDNEVIADIRARRVVLGRAGDRGGGSTDKDVGGCYR
jgi:hypothetical protein